jgi:hypothetical protein
LILLYIDSEVVIIEQQEHIVTNLVRAEDQLAGRNPFPSERDSPKRDPLKRTFTTQSDTNSTSSKSSNPFRQQPSVHDLFDNLSDHNQSLQPPVPYKTPQLPTKPLAYRQSLPISARTPSKLPSLEYGASNNAIGAMARSESDGVLASPSPPGLATLASAKRSQKHDGWQVLEKLLAEASQVHAEIPRDQFRRMKRTERSKDLADIMSGGKLDPSNVESREDVRTGLKLQTFPSATHKIMRDLERNRIKSLMKVPAADRSSVFGHTSQSYQQPYEDECYSSPHGGREHDLSKRRTMTPMSAAKFIDVHGDTFHIRFTAALVAELSKYPPNRGKLTGDEILKLIQKGTCWAGFCAELGDIGVLVEPSLVEGKDMRALGFWLGDAAVETTCGICPICLDRKHGFRVGSNSKQSSPYKARANHQRINSASKLEMAKKTWDEEFYRTAANRHFRPLWHDLNFLEEKLARERHTQLLNPSPLLSSGEEPKSSGKNWSGGKAEAVPLAEGRSMRDRLTYYPRKGEYGNDNEWDSEVFHL